MQLRTAVSRRRYGPLAPPWEGSDDGWTVALWLLGTAIVIWGAMCLIGLLLTHVIDRGSVHAADLGVNQWFAAERTSLWNDATAFGTGMAETMTVIIVTAVAALVLRWRTRRWREAVMLVTSIVGELVIFLATTAIVPQRRPSVHKLDPAPPTSSYPSGHTAAAVCLYGCLAILVLWLYAGRPGAPIVAGLLFCVPVFVALSRVYRGMHYPSDVLAGALLGALWLSLVTRTFLPHRPWGRGAGRQLPARGRIRH
ncbi:MAG TPA: phosphatase PAP2 family protein [Streptosporangiaceae bacterium]